MITSHVTAGEYTLISALNEPPQSLDLYRARAVCFQTFRDDPSAQDTFFLVAGDQHRFPSLALMIYYHQDQAGRSPETLLVAETGVVFVGVGKHVYGFQFDSPRLLWTRRVECGFGGWSRHGDLILMSAETELAAWTTQGMPLWTTLVEPCCTYRVDQGMIHLQVMDQSQSFSLAHGVA